MPEAGDTTRVRAVTIDAAEKAADLVESSAVVDRWNEPSALDGMTVGGLAAHLVRATGATLAYLDRTDPHARPTGDLLTKADYFRHAIEAPIHERIKEVSADEAAAGPAAVAAAARRVADDLAERLPAEPTDRLIGALHGEMLTLDDFCRTRMIETLVHIDDLAHSVGLPTPEFDEFATGEVIDILTTIARGVHGDWAVIHALARAERAEAGVLPVL